MFKWLCLAVAVLALGAFGWMFNDMRLQVKEVAANADKQLAEVKSLSAKADSVLTATEKAAANVNDKLPKILTNTETAAANVNEKLPQILAHTELAVDEVAGVAAGLKQYEAMMGVVHSDKRNEGMFGYASSILDLIDGQDDAAIGVKDAGKDAPIKKPIPAKKWVKMQRPQATLVSIGAQSKSDVLDSLAQTHSARPWYIQIAKQTPRLLSDWLMDAHPESKILK